MFEIRFKEKIKISLCCKIRKGVGIINWKRLVELKNLKVLKKSI